MCSERHIADFIQKNRTPIALLKLADPLRIRASEGALLMAKQLAFQQVFRNGRTIDRKVRLATALAVTINRTRHQLLARTTLAGDQGRRVTGRQLTDGLKHLLHRRALTDNAQIKILLLQQRLV